MLGGRRDPSSPAHTRPCTLEPAMWVQWARFSRWFAKAEWIGEGSLGCRELKQVCNCLTRKECCWSLAPSTSSHLSHGLCLPPCVSAQIAAGRHGDAMFAHSRSVGKEELVLPCSLLKIRKFISQKTLAWSSGGIGPKWLKPTCYWTGWGWSMGTASIWWRPQHPLQALRWKVSEEASVLMSRQKLMIKYVTDAAIATYGAGVSESIQLFH